MTDSTTAERNIPREDAMVLGSCEAFSVGLLLVPAGLLLCGDVELERSGADVFGDVGGASNFNESSGSDAMRRYVVRSVFLSSAKMATTSSYETCRHARKDMLMSAWFDYLTNKTRCFRLCVHRWVILQTFCSFVFR